MLPVAAEFGLARHPVKLFAHLVKRRIDAVPLGLGIFGNGVFNRNARLMIDRKATRHALNQFEASKARRGGRNLL